MRGCAGTETTACSPACRRRTHRGWGAGVLWLGFGSGSGVLPPLGSVGVVCSGVCCCSVEGDGEFDGDELLSLGVGVGCVCCRLL